jgi:hemerythrin superfamily protein
MKATTLLERQHRSLEQLCEAVERGSARVRESLLPQLAGDLVAHIAVEEEVFYPAACEALRERGWLPASRRRHRQARRALDRVFDAAVDGDEFASAITELRRALEVHARDDEERLFPELELVLDVRGMRALGLEMLPFYHARLEAGYARGAAAAPSPGNAARS